MTKLSQKSIEYKVLTNIKENNLIFPGEKIVVAVSGGPDSVCLFNILLKLRNQENFDLLVCHFNHRLRGKESDRDQAFVQRICADNSIECILGRANGVNSYKNEEEAREARYDFFEKILEKGTGDKVVTAHTADDSAETFLLRLIRGTGISGLRSIPFQRKKIIRPLLTVSRVEIEDYIKKEGLECVIDKTNKDIRFSRNYIRLKVLPLLKLLNPNIIPTLLNSARLFEEDYQFIDETARESYKGIVESDNDTIVLSRKKWLFLSPTLRRLTLRYAINKKVGLLDITQQQLKEVCNVIEKGIGNKHKILPHSLRVALESDKIVISVKK